VIRRAYNLEKHFTVSAPGYFSNTSLCLVCGWSRVPGPYDHDIGCMAVPLRQVLGIVRPVPFPAHVDIDRMLITALRIKSEVIEGKMLGGEGRNRTQMLHHSDCISLGCNA